MLGAVDELGETCSSECAGEVGGYTAVREDRWEGREGKERGLKDMGQCLRQAGERKERAWPVDRGLREQEEEDSG